MDGAKVLLSFVIPCYSSMNSVALVVDEIREVVAEKPEFDYEIIAVNDCSPDDTWRVLRQLAKQDAAVTAIDLAKNVGRHNALMCGCRFANGDYIVFVDDDQQCPIDQLWRLLEPLMVKSEDGKSYDVSIARYEKKTQAAWKNAGSKLQDVVSNWLLGKTSDLKFSNFSAMKSFVKDEIVHYSNPYPYLSGLMLRSTSRVCNVDMVERERAIGVGHSTFKKSVALWMNSFTAFSVKPLRIATACGFVFAAIGLISAIVVIVRKI